MAGLTPNCSRPNRVRDEVEGEGVSSKTKVTQSPGDVILNATASPPLNNVASSPYRKDASLFPVRSPP
jgi:hypothetical protein